MHALIFFLFFSLTFAAGDRGPNLDPDGLAAQSDSGCSVDPNGGRCVSGFADDGPYIDPNGRRVSAAGDKGMGLDPNG